MEINQLVAFIKVAETHSFSQAGELLHLTQPAISKRISVLEAFLNTPLFDRIGKRVILTEAGQILLPRARKILLELNDTRTSIRNLAKDVSGKLSLACSHHIGLHRLPPVLKAFSGRYPNVIVDISFLDSEEAYIQVGRGDIELAVVTLSLDPVERIVSHPIWYDPLGIMSSVDHDLVHYPQVKIDDLMKYPVILPTRNTFTRQLIDNAFHSKQIDLEIEMATNYLETIKMMVSIGMAWSILPLTMLDDSLRVLPVQNLKLVRELGYIYHQDHTLSNSARAFIELLEQQNPSGQDTFTKF